MGYLQELCEAAEAYSLLGWKMIPLNSVYQNPVSCSCYKQEQCISPGKHPKVKGWKEYATSDLDIVERWLRKWREDLNLGIATGEGSGLVVIDVDGIDGLNTLQTIEREFDIGEPPLSITGSGGAHLVYAYQALPGRPNRSRILPGIDFRTDGGLVVVPPSIHSSGYQYQWNALPRSSLPVLPQIFIDAIVSPENTPRTARRLDFNFGNWLAKEPPSIEGDNGSGQCMRVATKAVHTGKLRTFPEFLLAIEKWNAKCKPPWSEEELEHKFSDALTGWEESGTVDVPVGRTGLPISNVKVLSDILREDSEFAGKLSYDTAISTVLYNGHSLEDNTVTNIRVEIISRYPGLSVPAEDSFNAIVKVANESAFSSVEKYLRELKWDGTKRISRVAHEVLRVEESHQDLSLYNEFLHRWFIGAVARALKHGCKHDVALILKGPQGILKSTFFDVLGGQWYVDTLLDFQNPKDAYLNMARAWIYEWSEMENVYTQRETSRVKAFLSSREDTYRAPYGKVARTHPRKTIFVGTTNKHVMLHDHTGARRFWIIETEKKYSLSKLKKWRNQLWAEAVHYFEAGERWHLSDEVANLVESVNELSKEEVPTVGQALEEALLLLKDNPKGFKLIQIERRLGVSFSKDRRMQSEVTTAFRQAGLQPMLRGVARTRLWVRK